MKRYSSYTDSGVKWIGEIPDNWEVTKIKFVSRIYGRIGFRGYTVDDIVDKNEGAISLSPSNIVDQKITFKDSTFISFDKYFESPEIMIQNDDIVFVKTASVGKCAYVTNLPCESTLNPQLIVFKNCKIFNKFFYYSLISPLIQNQVFSDLTGGVVGTISQAKINNYFMVKPSELDEQIQIANYLDQKTTKIDELVTKKEQLIQLLEEEGTAIINETITKGLNPDVPMKDSGIDWLGSIPKHWGIKRLRYVGNCQNGISEGADFFGEGHPFVSYSDVFYNRTLPFKVEGLAKSEDKHWNNYSVIEGDVFFTRTSETIEEIGIASVCQKSIDKGTFAGFLIRFRPYPNTLITEFSKYYFRCFIPRIFFVKEMNLVTRASLSQELLKRLPILLPSLKEQVLIAEYLDEKVGQIENVISKTKAEILHLKEYKTTLISEVVTGKIDIREEN